MLLRCLLLIASWGAAVTATPCAARADESPPRRTLHVSVGMGASRDRAPTEAAAKPLTAFFSSVGVGQGLLGIELLGAGSAGRGTDVSRMAFELDLVLRPLTLLGLPSERFAGRLARGLGLTAGPGVELMERSRANATRLGVALGGHLDVPLTPVDLSRELRLRLSGRRLLAGSVQLGEHIVGSSSFEAWAALVLAF